RYYISDPHEAAWRIDTRPIDAHIAGAGKHGGGASRTHQPGMPKPSVDALAIRFGRHSAALLCLGLKLRLQRRELGKGRIWVGCPLTRFVPRSIWGAVPVAPRTLRPAVLRALPAALAAMADVTLLRRLRVRRPLRGGHRSGRCVSGCRLRARIGRNR